MRTSKHSAKPLLLKSHVRKKPALSRFFYACDPGPLHREPGGRKLPIAHPRAPAREGAGLRRSKTLRPTPGRHWAKTKDRNRNLIAENGNARFAPSPAYGRGAGSEGVL